MEGESLRNVFSVLSRVYIFPFGVSYRWIDSHLISKESKLSITEPLFQKLSIFMDWDIVIIFFHAFWRWLSICLTYELSKKNFLCHFVWIFCPCYWSYTGDVFIMFACLKVFLPPKAWTLKEMCSQSKKCDSCCAQPALVLFDFFGKTAAKKTQALKLEVSVLF